MHFIYPQMISLGMQAQKLLEEANKQAELHAAMQCKQRVEQKAIIIKHEVNDSFFFILFGFRV